MALKYHKCLSGRGRHPPNSLSALREILEGKAAALEFDVRLGSDGSFMLNHDATLERETSGVGPVCAHSRRELERLCLRDSAEPVAFLSDVVEGLEAVAHPLKVQVDFKELSPIGQEEAAWLLGALTPLRENRHIRVVVGCLADWNLRMLRRLAPELELGLDFAYHLDAPVDGLVRLPTRTNAYGYLDDHPLGFRRLLSPADYLRDRVETLLGLVSNAAEFYLRKDFVQKALDDGFNPVQFIHDHLPGSLVDVWTLDYGEPDMMATVLEAGADQITTNTPLQWAEALKPSP